MKDLKLYELSKSFNTALFASFGPDLVLRHTNFAIEISHYKFILSKLLRISGTNCISIRSFLPDKFSGNPFYHRESNFNAAVEKLESLAAQGYYTIINESTDDQQAFSGSVRGDVLDVVFGTTPRGVETSANTTLPRDIGFKLLEKITNFKIPKLPRNSRIEFTILPYSTGHLKSRFLVWEQDDTKYEDSEPVRLLWPNNLSRLIGDKAFGLLVADILRHNVPATTCMVRDQIISPFCFGEKCGIIKNYWTRTCPKEPVPGKYDTYPYFVDPVELMCDKDPEDKDLVSCLIQGEIKAEYSGAALFSDKGDIIVEGVAGFGDEFMLGNKPAEKLPDWLIDNVHLTMNELYSALGEVRIEWISDLTDKLYIVQLHIGYSESNNEVIYPGDPEHWWEFNSKEGSLEDLRSLAEEAKASGFGILVNGKFGLTCHFADVIRKAKIPAKFKEQ